MCVRVFPQGCDAAAANVSAATASNVCLSQYLMFHENVFFQCGHSSDMEYMERDRFHSSCRTSFEGLTAKCPLHEYEKK